MYNDILNEGVKDIFSSLIKWFNEKLQQVKEKISKITSKFRGKEQELPQEKKSALHKFLSASKDVVSNCKKGISASRARKKEAAMKYKENVSKGLKLVTLVASTLAASKVEKAVSKKINGTNIPRKARLAGLDLGVKHGRKTKAKNEETDIEVLIEADREIGKQIKKALDSLAKWFKDKIQQIKDKLNEIVAKFKKEELPPEKKSLLSKLKSTGGNIISSCKRGISACKSKSIEAAKKEKEITNQYYLSFKKILGSVAKGAARGTVGVVAGKAAKGYIRGRMITK